MALEMQHITKTFGATKALSDVSFSLEEGAIHGLLGENGAGKTTLMNILAGTFPPDSGKVILDGTEIKNINPAKAGELGIRFIHQELNLCNHLKVYQNMFLGQELVKALNIKKEEEIKLCQEVLDRMHADIKAEDMVGNITAANKQLVEIARALLFKSKIIIMDEPTTALNSKEIETLFSLMRELQKENVSFIYISHKMPEIFEICSDYTVLRDGQFIKSGKISDIDEKIATELLIGKAVNHENARDRSDRKITDEIVLSVNNLFSDTFSDVSFELKKGEVLVLTGLQGSGVADLATALFCATDISEGTIETKLGKIEKRNEREAISKGIAMVPRNRKERGILPQLSIRDNNSISYFTSKHKKLFINESDENNRYFNSQKEMSIKAGSHFDPITSLSGGNQQKVIISRWLNIEADVMILDNPTQGIDVGAKFEIYMLINKLASEGKSLVVVSNEFPEIYHIADRVLVFYKGKINGELTRDNLTEINMMSLSTGGTI